MFQAALRSAALAVISTVLVASVQGDDIPDFNREVRTILSNNCFRCHGPDEGERKAKTRLDVPGQADLREVVARISSKDPDERMPPPESNKSLTTGQVDTLQRWIAGGAAYAEHWAFVPPAKGAVPADANPIDHFIAMRLQQEQLTPAPGADAFTLVRRLHLDLIGLPPTPEETDAFLDDQEPGAYERLVERLLGSQHYGERWARRWLDLARYADTNGYEKDRDRSIWPYRDWVIRAINADMPFDQFTIEQLAGDMLPDPSPDQVVATGFHRNTMLNEEGGIDPLEFRFHAMTDRVATTGTTWLGLTTGCAQCHTHKFDPITHADYYGMMAYLNNADEPDYQLRDAGAAAAASRNLAEAAQLLTRLPDLWPPDGDQQGATTPPRERALAAFEKWLADARANAIDWRPLEPTSLTANFPYLIHEGEGVLFAGGDTSKHDIYTITFPAADQPVTALRLEALPDERLPDGGPGTTFYEGRKGDFYLTEIAVEGSTIASATETYAQNRFGNNPVSAALTIDGDIQTGWSVAGRIGERHVAVYVLKEAIPAGQPVAITMHFGRHYASSLGKFRISATSATSAATSATSGIGALAAIERDADTERLLARDGGALTEAERAELFQAFLLEAPELAAHAGRIRELRKPPGGTTTLVLRERPLAHPRPTFLHHRGEFLSPRERVLPRLPDALVPAGMTPPSDRLGFARWLVSRENPLTARVVVNRHWAAFFGTGIVSTLDDFGMQGALPTHPELLDHLAVSFMEHGWSVKSLHRQIVLSAAYRRASSVAGSSAPPPPAALLARFPRTRLDAEIIRDGALRMAGLLSDTMFGAPVRPPQPDGVTEVAYGSPKWNASSGADRYRRSLYTYQKRTAPFAMFTTFDAGSGEACLARRDVSNTPLQALTLMNDPMFLEIAAAFGREIDGWPGDAPDKIRHAFRRVLTRPATTSELSHLERFHASHQDWTALARALLSLDETITKP